MYVEEFDRGFFTHINNGIVEKIECHYHEPLMIHFVEGPPKVLDVEGDCYQAQFGFPVSPDGSKLYTMSWETGITAYDIQTGAILWKYRRSRIGRIETYSTYLVAKRDCIALLKMDLETGAMLQELKSGTIKFMYPLVGPYVLVNTYRGKFCVVDTETMTIARQYSKKETNPYDCLSQIVQSVELRGNQIILRGREGGPRGKPIRISEMTLIKGKFERELDFDLPAKPE